MKLRFIWENRCMNTSHDDMASPLSELIRYLIRTRRLMGYGGYPDDITRMPEIYRLHVFVYDDDLVF